jgi:hypothetical protein
MHTLYSDKKILIPESEIPHLHKVLNLSFLLKLIDLSSLKSE